MDIRILTIKLESNRISRRDIPKVRGYIAGKFPEHIELHNHLDGNKFNYAYPLIQYKVIEGIPNIIAINEASKILIEVFNNIEEIDIKNTVMSILEKGYFVKKEVIEAVEEMISYRFITPWMALNQNNYEEYMHADEKRKSGILKKILIGNILSMSKSLKYSVDRALQVFLRIEPIPVNFKNQQMIAFKGDFLVNFLIPDYLGLGKSVSRGFGTVVRIRDGGFR